MIVSWFWLWYILLTTAADMLFDSDICLKTWYNCVWGKWTNSCSAVFHLSHWITCSRSFVLASLLCLPPSLYHFLLTLKFLFKICKWTSAKNFKFAFLGLRLRTNLVQNYFCSHGNIWWPLVFIYEKGEYLVDDFRWPHCST